MCFLYFFVWLRTMYGRKEDDILDRYMQLYETNKEFHDYVERLRRPGKNDEGRPLEELLSGVTVQNIGDYYASRPNSENVSPVFPVSPNDFCSCEDKSC